MRLMMVLRSFFAVALLLSLAGCDDSGSDQAKSDKPELLIYCGITMAHPMKEIATIMEPILGRKIVISQGGSEDLYVSLKSSKKGDLYLPGSPSYRKRHLDEGLLGETVDVGFNQASMMVRKGNPYHLTADLNNLTRSDLKVVISSPDSGSIGRETKKILEKAGLYQVARENSAFLATDSRNLNRALKNGEADVIINWRATAFFEENINDIQVLDLPADVAEPKKLVLNLLTFSLAQEDAKKFMDYATSEEGQAIFRKWGFLDKNMKADE